MYVLSSPKWQIVLTCFACSFLIIIYGTFRCKNSDFKDPLTASAFGHPWNRFLDGWGISHFMFYLLLAYVFPAEWAFIFCMGVLWELIEFIFKDHPFYLSKCAYSIDTDHGAGWWYGRWEDIVMNSLGIALGCFLGR